MSWFRRDRPDEIYWGDPQQVPQDGAPARPAQQVGAHAAGLGHRPLVDPTGSVYAGPPGDGQQPSEPRPPGRPRHTFRSWLVAVVIVVTAGIVVGLTLRTAPEHAGSAPTSRTAGVATTTGDAQPSTTSRTMPSSAQGSVSRTIAPSTTADDLPARSPMTTGRQGAPTLVRVGDNTFRITVGSTVWQPTAKWGHHGDADRGYLIVPITVRRIDDAAHVTQISWGDWTLTGRSSNSEAELIAGGYESREIATIRLDPAATVTGNLVFDAAAEAATLTLRDAARWRITTPRRHKLGKPVPLGTPVRGQGAPGEVPFDVTVESVEWIPNGDPSLDQSMPHGYFLAATFTIRPHAGIDPNVAFVLYHNWSVTLGERTFAGASGTYRNHRVGTVNLTGGKPVTGYAIFDAPGLPGTVSLIGRDGKPLMSWTISGPS